MFETILNYRNLIDEKFIPDPAKHPETLLSESKRGCAVSVTPFANALIAVQREPKLRIIAGSGLNGISMIGRTVSTAKDLKGKKLAHRREILLKSLQLN